MAVSYGERVIPSRQRVCGGMLCLSFLILGACSESPEPTTREILVEASVSSPELAVLNEPAITPIDTALYDPAVIATIGGVPITVGSLRREMLRAGGHDPSRFDEFAEKRAALETVIRVEVLARAALEAQYDKNPKIQDEYKQLLGQRFWADRQRDNLPIPATEEEIRSYYDAHRSEFEETVQVRGSIALLRARADATTEQRQELRKKADTLAKDVVEGRIVFAELARQHSDDRFTRQRGGDVGWVTPGHRSYRWEREVIDALSGTEELAGRPQIIETTRGVYLVQITGRRGGELIPLEGVRKRIAIELSAESQRGRAEADYAELRDRYTLVVDESLLQTIGPESSIAAMGGPPTFPVGKPSEKSGSRAASLAGAPSQ